MDLCTNTRATPFPVSDAMAATPRRLTADDTPTHYQRVEGLRGALTSAALVLLKFGVGRERLLPGEHPILSVAVTAAACRAFCVPHRVQVGYMQHPGMGPKEAVVTAWVEVDEGDPAAGATAPLITDLTTLALPGSALPAKVPHVLGTNVSADREGDRGTGIYLTALPPQTTTPAGRIDTSYLTQHVAKEGGAAAWVAAGNAGKPAVEWYREMCGVFEKRAARMFARLHEYAKDKKKKK